MLVSALVLAAGKSSRMAHHHKLLLPWENKAMVVHTVDHLLQAQVAEVVVVLGYNADAVRVALSARPVRFVFNENFAEGISTSIKAGLAACQKNSHAFLICLADQPLVAPGEINQLIKCLQQTSSSSIAVPTYNGQRGNPVLFKQCHLAEMNELIGDSGCKTLIRQHEHEVLEVTMPSDHVLRDVDTWEEYQALTSVMQSNSTNQVLL